MASSKVILCEGSSTENKKFFTAVRDNDKELVQELIEDGEDINQTDEQGETPLIIAASLGFEEVIFFKTCVACSFIHNLSILNILQQQIHYFCLRRDSGSEPIIDFCSTK